MTSRPSRLIAVLLSTSLLLPYAVFADESTATSTPNTEVPKPYVTEPPVPGDQVIEATTQTVPPTATTTVPVTPPVPPVSATTTPNVLPPVPEDMATTSSSTPGTVIANTSGTSTPPSVASSTPVIESGEAVAVANILNLLNTNVVNSTGAVVLGNYFNTATDTIDLRSSNPFGALACGLLSCSGSGVSVHVGDNASIDNAVVLSASSGGNNLQSNSDGVINTGDAYAGLNLVNLANTNIVDSNYLLVTVNAFHGVQGDVVFPSLSSFLGQLAHGSSGQFDVNSSADVVNDIHTSADAGGNSTDAASSTIVTGDSTAVGNVFNRINTAEFGGSAVSILFRVQGNWTGQIFGAPPGLAWTRGTDGSIFLFDSGNGTGANASANLTGSSTASIHNNVSVMALTGQNHVAAPGTALISTGNAFAGANVVNVANTSIVGRNWILAVINIFGDFTGSIAFGRPDLWVGEKVDVPTTIDNGSDVTYTFTVINNGDSDATNATLTDAQDLTHLAVHDASVPYTLQDGKLHWELGTIPAGKAVEVTYRARVQNSTPGTKITDTVKVQEHETDNALTDNTDTATIETWTPSQYQGGSSSVVQNTEKVTPAALLDVTVEREIATTTVSQGEQAHEVLTVRNTGSTITPTLALHDVLRDPSGILVQDQSGPIDPLKPGEAVSISYDLSFAANAPVGTYTLATVLDTGDEHQLQQRSGAIVVQAGHGGVLGAHTPARAVTGSPVTKVAVPANPLAQVLGVQTAQAETNLAAAVGTTGTTWQMTLALVLAISLAIGAGIALLRRGMRTR